MKNLLILIVLIIAAGVFSNSQAAQHKTLLKGELVQEADQLALYSDLGRVELHSDEGVNIQQCFDGVFEVALEAKGSAKFKFLQTKVCRDKGSVVIDESVLNSDWTGGADTKGNFCPMIYDPVCGLVTTVVCENDHCVERQIPRTFGNNCQLNVAGAKKLFHGRCELMKNIDLKGVQTFDTPDVVAY